MGVRGVIVTLAMTCLLAATAQADTSTASLRRDCKSSKDPETTIAACTKLLGIDRPYLDWYTIRDRRAEAYIQIKNYQGALKDLNALIGASGKWKYGEKYGWYFKRALVHGLLRNGEAALSDAEIMVREFPDYQLSFATRAAAYLLLGRKDEARRDLETAKDNRVMYGEHGLDTWIKELEVALARPDTPEPTPRTPPPDTLIEDGGGPGPIIIEDNQGGMIGDFRSVLSSLSQVVLFGGKAVPIEIRGECASSCTLYLSGANTCVHPDARLMFHAAQRQGYGQIR